MNKRLVTTGVTIGALLLIGSVSVDAYYTHELAKHTRTGKANGGTESGDHAG